MDWLINWLWEWFESSESKLVRTVREVTVQMCGFLPTVETAAALVAVSAPASAPVITTAVTIAKKICSAVTAAKPAMLLGTERPPIIVDGVVIDGQFVNKEK
jgi:hypothetical protein